MPRRCKKGKPSTEETTEPVSEHVSDPEDSDVAQGTQSQPSKSKKLKVPSRCKKGKTLPVPKPPTEEKEPVSEHISPDPGDSDASQTTQPETSKIKKLKTGTSDGDKGYPWKEGHQDTLAEFWLINPIFFDKSLEHYKNKDMKTRLIQELIEHNREDWEKIQSPLLTVTQVDAHLRSMRTRFVKLLKRKSGAPAVALSYTEQNILCRYQFLRPHIQRNRTTATYIFPGLVNADGNDDGSGDDDQSLLGNIQDGQQSEMPGTSKAKSKGKGKKLPASSTLSPLTESDDVPAMEIMQQAKSFISNVRTPILSEHERRVRDFSRYMESELLRVPEPLWDECSFTIMNVIRGFKSAKQPGNVSLQQQQAIPSYGSNIKLGGYYTQQTSSIQQPQQFSAYHEPQLPGTFQPLGTFQQLLGNFQPTPQQPPTQSPQQQEQSCQDQSVYTNITTVMREEKDSD